MAEHSHEPISFLAVLPDPVDRDSLSAIIRHSNWKLDFAKPTRKPELPCGGRIRAQSSPNVVSLAVSAGGIFYGSGPLSTRPLPSS